MRCDLCGRKSELVRRVRFAEAIDIHCCPPCQARKERQHQVVAVELKQSPCAKCREPKTRKHEGGDCRVGCELLAAYQDRAASVIYDSAGVVDLEHDYSFQLGGG